MFYKFVFLINFDTKLSVEIFDHNFLQLCKSDPNIIRSTRSLVVSQFPNCLDGNALGKILNMT